MSPIEIRHWNGKVLYTIETGSIKVVVETLVKQGANLRGANLNDLNCLTELSDAIDLGYGDEMMDYSLPRGDCPFGECLVDEKDTEIARLKRCYESATGKMVCGEGSVIRVECTEMTRLRELIRGQQRW